MWTNGFCLSRITLVWLSILCVAFGGCARSVLDMTKPDEADSFPVPPIPKPVTVGSLWEERNERAYMFGDLRAKQVGDIVVVQIVEQHKGSKSADTTAERQSTYDNSLGGSIFGLNNFASALADGVKLDASTQNQFKGSGSTSREDTLTGTIAARVIEVMSNGDLRIKGKRQVTINSERQTMTITGIVRRIDLDTGNTVLSTAVADARIEYTGLGVVDEVQRPGWLVRILDWISIL